MQRYLGGGGRMMDNKCILYLVKIGKKEYLDKTISKGEFYMNTCEYFDEKRLLMKAEIWLAISRNVPFHKAR